MAKQTPKTASAQDNPKTDPADSSNKIKDPDQWTTAASR